MVVFGCGVGMDVVQEFFKCEYGCIELCFIDDNKGVVFCQFQMVVCLFECFVVDSVNVVFGV